jgi:hypothetical protein
VSTARNRVHYIPYVKGERPWWRTWTTKRRGWKAAPISLAAVTKEVASYRTSVTGDGPIRREDHPMCPMKFVGLRYKPPA